MHLVVKRMDYHNNMHLVTENNVLECEMRNSVRHMNGRMNGCVKY